MVSIECAVHGVAQQGRQLLQYHGAIVPPPPRCRHPPHMHTKRAGAGKGGVVPLHRTGKQLGANRSMTLCGVRSYCKKARGKGLRTAGGKLSQQML